MNIPPAAIIAASSYLIPPGAAISRFRSLDRGMKIFFAYCVFSFSEVLCEYIFASKGINNSFLSNYSIFIECGFLSLVYSMSTEERRIQQAIAVLASLFVCVWIVDKIYFEIPGRINDEMAVASRIFIVVISILIIQTLLKKTNTLITDKPIFWISAGNILYSAGVLVVLGLSNELIKGGEVYFQVAWYINWSLAIVTNLIFTKGLLCKVNQ